MDSDSARPRAAYFYEVADSLRKIADQVHFDWRRKNQIMALADGFERFANRLAEAAGNKEDSC